MFWRDKIRPISGLLLVALVMSGPLLHHDKVLCIQSESHILVERVGADCCRQEVIKVAPGLSSVSSAAEDCGSCRDLQFAQDTARTVRFASAIQSIYSTNGLSVYGHLPLFVRIGGQASKQAIPLYPLKSNFLSNLHPLAVIRC